MQISELSSSHHLDERALERLYYYLEKTDEAPDNFIQKLFNVYEMYKSHEMETFSIADAIGYGIYVTDREKTIIKANKSYGELTGMWEKEYLGKSIKTVLKDFFVNSRAVALEALRTGKKVEGLGRPVRTNKDLLVTAIPIPGINGEITSVLTVLRDVTEQMTLQNSLNKNLEKSEVYEHELNYFRSREKLSDPFIGNSKVMQQIRTLIAQVAPVDATILISGETGVGKEVVSRELHARSNRKEYSHIKVNCAAIPEYLMESEFFGYEKGAFTGAGNKRKIGFFEMANHGTIFLDEIAEIPLVLQSKLLRVLQEKEITRLGGGTPVAVDVRILAATNKDLKQEVEKGRFRKDLYYRLCVIPIHIPPLRERLSDTRLLAEHFLHKYNKKYNVHKAFSNGAFEVLTRYDWPGNVRELENIIERLLVISNVDLIEDEMVSSVIGITENKIIKSLLACDTSNLKCAVNSLEKQMIETALAETGSSYRAAEKLGLDQSTIIRKAKKLGITAWKERV